MAESIGTQTSHLQTSIPEESMENFTYNNPPAYILQKLQNKFPPSSSIVQRSDDIKLIVNILLNAQRKQSKNIIALWGLGGCGKTVLALMICCLTEVIAHFQGRIFWVDLAEGKDIVEGMKTLYKQSTESESIFNTVAEIATDLLNKWNNKPNEPRLIVLDNLQQPEELEYFLSSRNQDCSWLITTIDRESFPGNNSVEAIQIDTPNIDDATLMLSDELREREEYIEFEKLKQLVSQLYEWPALINFVKKEIYRKTTGKNNTVNNAIDDILKDIKENDWSFCLDNTSDYENLRSIIESSIKRLNEQQRKRLEELVIFPKDIPIPVSVIAKLWNLKITSAIRLCERLDNLSLLQRYDAKKKTICMNNILRQYLLQDEKIRERRSEIHKKLLEAYENS